MSSLRQRRANRRNGQRNQGADPEKLLITCRNSLKTGFAGHANVIVPEEFLLVATQRQEFWRKAVQPDSPLEEFYFDVTDKSSPGLSLDVTSCKPRIYSRSALDFPGCCAMLNPYPGKELRPV
jgi:hypothetical protein